MEILFKIIPQFLFYEYKFWLIAGLAIFSAHKFSAIQKFFVYCFFPCLSSVSLRI